MAIFDTLGVIGCGKMSLALLKGIPAEQWPDLTGINDIDPQQQEMFTQQFKAVIMSKAEIAEKCDTVILAVKPQQIRPVLDEIKPYMEKRHLLLSVAAGVNTADIEEYSGRKAAVIRVMPNTPCLIGQGVSVLSPGQNVQAKQVKQAADLLAGMGLVRQVEEKYMDAVTAISGSGPAYVYLFAEAMINAGVYLGLPLDVTRQLVIGTIAGSAGMLAATQEHPAVLKDQVCSPGGTTIAAIKQMEEDGLRWAVINGIEKAYLRSIELG